MYKLKARLLWLHYVQWMYIKLPTATTVVWSWSISKLALRSSVGAGGRVAAASAKITQHNKTQRSPARARVMPSSEPKIAPFAPPTPKTLAYNQICSGSDAPFARYSPLNYTVTLKLGLGSLKVIESGTIQYSTYDFIFVFHSNYASLYYRFRDIATYWSKITNPLYLTPLLGVKPSDLRNDPWWQKN